MKLKWQLIGSVLLAVCLIISTVSVLPVMAAGSTQSNTKVSGDVTLLIYNVGSSAITTNSATITWGTNGASTSQVFYDTASHPSKYAFSTSIDSNLVTSHSVPLTGLTPNTTYYYVVQSTGTFNGNKLTATSPEYSLQTLAQQLSTLTVSASPNPVTQTSLSSSSTITVTAKDQYNNPMSGVVVNLGVGSPGSLNPTQITTSGSNGQATATLTLTQLVTTTTTVTVNANSGGVTGQTSVTFNLPPLHPTNIYLVNWYPNPSTYGQTVYFVALVYPNGFFNFATGTVSFYDGGIGGTYLGTNSLLFGWTFLSTDELSAGTHTIVAVYNGNSYYATSTSNPVTQVVKPASTTTSLTSSANPSVYGQAVSFTAMVSAVSPGGGTPSGSVQFKIDGINFGGAVSLSSGSATSGNITTLAVGSHTITAVYTPNTGNYNTSTGTLSQKVNKASTTTSLISSKNPSDAGQSVMFTASVSPVSPGAGTPTGSVQFKDGGSLMTNGTVTLVNGVAKYTTSSLSAGSHSITAVYSGDTNFTTSTSNTVKQTVYALPSVKTTSLPAGDVGVAYSQTLAATGGSGTGYTWSKSGSWPTWLSLSSTGVISGTPSATGTYTFSVVVTDSLGGASSPKSLSIKINAAPSITTSTLPNGTKGTSYSQTIAMTGGTSPFAWSIISGSLPPGLTLNATTGVISGKPTTSGTYNFMVKVNDAAGGSATKSLSIKIN